MSYTTLSLIHSRRFAGTKAPRKPLSLAATLVWGTAGIAALMIFWITGQLPWQLGSHPVLVLVSFGHVAALTMVMTALWFHGLPVRDTLALPSLRWRDVSRGALFGVLGYLLLFFVYALIPLIQSALGGSAGVPAFLPPRLDGAGLTLVSLWFGMVVAAPIAEELLFRGLIYRGLSDSRLGALGAVVLTSIAFGLVHYPGFGWPRVIGTACIGLLFGWLRWHGGNTWAGMVAHAVMNLMGAALLTVFVLVS